MIATESERSPTRVQLPTARRYGALLCRYLAPQWRAATFLAVVLLGSIGLQLLVPQVLRRFIDLASTSIGGGAIGDAAASAPWWVPPGGLTGLAVLFLFLALGTQVLGALATFSGAAVGWTATNFLRRDLAAHCLSLDLGFHKSRTAGEMIERIDGDVTALSDFFSQFSVRVLGGLLLLVGILVVLWIENPWVGLALTVFTLLELVVLTWTRSVAVPATQLEREANAQLFGFIEERLAGIEDIRANGGGRHAMYRFLTPVRTFFFNTRRAWMRRSVVWLSSYGLFVLGSLITLAASIHLVMTGAISLGTGYMVFQYMIMLHTPIEQITQQMQLLQRAGASVGRVDELLTTRSALAADEGRGLPDGPLEVRFDGVHFRYGDAAADAPHTLGGIDFRLAPGRTLGLLGRTGSGKTTLTRLLFRFYDPTEGVVRLSGVPTTSADIAELRAKVAMVTQDVQLFAASVRDNLTFFDPTLPDDRLTEVLHDVGLGEWLAGLPEGLETPIKAGGSNLSAGEAQLLAFARVFLKDPGLVILDEPSSRLDPTTERHLSRCVDRLLRGRTAIIIAHRLETVERADEVMVLDIGRIAEHGPRASLAADPTTRYARLLAAGRGLDANLRELA
jgi:ABC-type multidrug transport system fused ATPase/permease subunit